MDNCVPVGTVLDVYDKSGRVVATVVVGENKRAVLQDQIDGHTLQEGRIRLHAYDEFQLMGLAGFVFELTDERDASVCELITDAGGYALTDFIPFGSYRLHNIKADSPYRLREEVFLVQLKNVVHVPLIEVVFN